MTYLIYPGADFTVHPAPADDWAHIVIVDNTGTRVAAFCTALALDVYIAGVIAQGKTIADIGGFKTGTLAEPSRREPVDLGDGWVDWQPGDDPSVRIYAFRTRDAYVSRVKAFATVGSTIPGDWVNHTAEDENNYLVAIKVKP